MSKRNFKDRIKLASYDDMFKNSLLDDEDNGVIKEIPLCELHTFKGHPFKVVNDEKMEEMVESISKYGVLVPAIARERKNGGYEIISGHRRHFASVLAGKETMPVIVKEYTDDESTIIMVDANIQREDILPSEKARAYKMKYEALKHQGAAGGITLDTMSETAGENKKTIQRYIWLANLNDDLLNLVDEKRLGFGQGVDISFLEKNEQEWIYDLIQSTGCMISGVQSAQIKKLSKEGKLSLATLGEILKSDSKKVRKVVFNSKKLDSYFEPNMSNEDIESLIISLLEEWKEKGGRSLWNS